MNLPIYEPDDAASYTLDVVARITGIQSETILHYQETGLIGPDPYNDDTVRTLRRIEHLRSSYEVNEAALKLILGLMERVERSAGLRPP